MYEQNNDNGGSNLHCAVAGKFTNLVISLLERTTIELINTKDKNGQTPLHLACCYSLSDNFVLLDCEPTDLPYRKLSEMKKIIQLLLSHGADPTIIDNVGKSPFHLLINSLINNWNLDNDHLENIGKKIIDHFLQNGVDINIKDAKGRTPLHYVVESLNMIITPPKPRHIVQLPRNLGPIERRERNNRAVRIARERRIHQDAALLPHAQPDILDAVNFMNERHEEMPIFENFDPFNRMHEEPDIFDEIFEGHPLPRFHLQPNVQNSQAPYTCEQEVIPPFGFEWKVEECQLEVVPPLDQVRRKQFLVHLLNKGADINAVDNELRTPLHLAVVADKYHIVEELLLRNANVNVRDSKGQTPLHHGVSSSKKLRHCGMLLLKKGALASIKDEMDNTPINIALGKAFFPIFIKFVLLFISVKMHPEVETTAYSRPSADICKEECQRLNKYFEESGCSQLFTLLQTYRLPVYTKNEFFASKINEPGFGRTFQNYSEIIKRKFSQDKRRMEMIEYCSSCIDRLGNLSSVGDLTPFYWKELPEEIKQKILSYLSDNDLQQWEERFRMVLALRYTL